ncbi:hypothetical protein AHAS_Ahas08G0047200 [Arachis hypogaea]
MDSLEFNSEHSQNETNTMENKIMVSCWWIWRWRNKEIFSPLSKRPREAGAMIEAYILSINEAYQKKLLKPPTRRIEAHIKWQQAPKNWIKIILMEQSRVNPGPGRYGRYGGVLRNEQRRWVTGYMVNCKAFQDEPRGIIHG